MKPLDTLLQALVAALALAAQPLAAAPASGDPSFPTAVSLVRVSPQWNDPAVALVGLPAIRSGVIRFAADEVLYEGTAPAVRPLVKSSTYLPDSVDTFTFFEKDHERLNYDLIAGEELLFVGRDPRGNQGIFHCSSNKLIHAWVPAGAQVPGALERFAKVRYPHGIAGRVAFVGYTAEGRRGVYRASSEGVLERVADTQVTAPGTEVRFTDFSYARLLRDGTVVFTGYSEAGSGIYVAREGQGLVRLIDRQTVEPRTKRNYAGVLLVGVEDRWAYFTSFGATLSIGRIQLDGSTLETLVADDAIPSLYPERIGAINYASVDHERVLFEAATHGTDFDIFLWEAGKVRPVVRHGDLLEGGKVCGLRVGLQGLSGSRFACLLDIRKGEAAPVQRAVYMGDLSPAAAQSVGAVAPKASQSRDLIPWLKLGRSPVSVFAREPSQPEGSPSKP
ncbi:MAG TPA: hypothetical protein DCM86_06895 [Verrucomicrobiales bacterium]|nr:hypothetical protein [Verrucomicrobiales bacterium]